MEKPASADAAAPACPEPGRSIATLERGSAEEMYQVRQSLIDCLLANPRDLLASARLVPHLDDGGAAGVRILAIRPGSVPDLLGLENGDVLRRLDDRDLGAAVEDGPVLYTPPLEHRLEITRRGQARVLRYLLAP